MCSRQSSIQAALTSLNNIDLPPSSPSASNSTMAVVFEKLAVKAIEDIAKEVLGTIIQDIEQLITNEADNPNRVAFTQGHVEPAADLVIESVNILIIFAHDPHDASDLLAKGWKMGKLKCPCPHAGNTLLCTFPCPFPLHVDPRKWDGPETDASFAR